MTSGTRTTSKLPKLLLLGLFLTLATAAMASTAWYVDGVNGNDNNDCLSSQTACQTIGHAIALCSSGDSILVAPAIYTENLTINFSLTIIGSDAATTIVDGNQAGSVFTISSDAAYVRLSKLTIQNGSAQSGGGISNSGTLTIDHCSITGNRGLDGSGGGILNSASLAIKNSTISGNTGGTGGILNTGGLTVVKSTISGNSGDTGGLANMGGTVTISNSTISQNISSGYWTGGINTNGGRLGISNSTISSNIGRGFSSLTFTSLKNTIVAYSTGQNCDGYAPGSDGYNLSSDNTCNFNGPGDMNNIDPLLGKLRHKGGPTKTMRLRLGSPAIDAGNPSGCTDGNGNLLKTDQRGKPRPGKYDSGACDMGAFERQRD